MNRALRPFPNEHDRRPRAARPAPPAPSLLRASRSAAPSALFADRYELGAALGRGGMGEVFEAVGYGAQGFARRVAIKRLIDDLADDPRVVRMFLDEARIASQLHHSGIVSVLDYGVADGAPFQVLELVEGWDVAKLYRMARLRNEPIPVEVALLLATEVAHALAYAHERRDMNGEALGIIHRDVKPSNILVSKAGVVKLGDFGIAFARERSAVTTGFASRGTPGFMSPEQLVGGAVCPASDIFAVGIMLHGLLSRRNPLGAEGPARLFSGREIEVAPDIPLDAREIIQRAARVKPEERYASARELAQALGEVLAPRLSTDPKTRMTRWLASLSAPAAPRTATVARAAIGRSVVAGHFVHAPRGSAEITRTLPRLKVAAPRRRERSGLLLALVVLAPLAVVALVLAFVFAQRALPERPLRDRIVREPAVGADSPPASAGAVRTQGRR